jgi:citrate lyase beta subunit
VPVANEVFSPSDGELVWAHEVLAANAEAAREGRGSFPLNGLMIDAASLRMARATLARAEAGSRRPEVGGGELGGDD